MSDNSSSLSNPCIQSGSGCTTTITSPSFVDTSACLCALQISRASLDSSNELWRCIGNASADVAEGNNGKWWYTINADTDIQGFNMPINWDKDPPDLTTAYVLTDDGDGGIEYTKLNGTDSGNGNLSMIDGGCTAKNDTELSAKYYAKGKGASSSSNGSNSTSTSSSSPSTTQGSQATTSGLPTSTSAAVTTSNSPTQSAASAANRGALKTALIFGLWFLAFSSLFL